MSEYLAVAKESEDKNNMELADVFAKQVGGFGTLSRSAFEAFVSLYTSSILAKQQAAHDAESAKLKEEARTSCKNLFDESNRINSELHSQLSAANAACAMKDAALGFYANGCHKRLISNLSTADELQEVRREGWDDFGDLYNGDSQYVEDGKTARDAISATTQQVFEWERKQLDPLQKLSVTSILLRVEPDLDGNSHEVYAKSVAEVEEVLSSLFAEVEDYELGIKVAPCVHGVIEPLRAQVARLSAALEEYETFIEKSYEHSCECGHDELSCKHCGYASKAHEVKRKALHNTQSTAEAFIAECEQRGAVKALEEAAAWFEKNYSSGAVPAKYIRKIMRATSKKAG